MNRCCEGRITPLTVKGLGMDIVHLISLEMWLVAVFDSSIGTCGCCKDKFHVCVLVFFGQSCSLSALNTQPLFGSELHPCEGAEPVEALEPSLSACHGSSSLPTLGWNQRKENLPVVSRGRARSATAAACPTSPVSSDPVLPEVLLLLRAGEDGHSNGSQGNSERE